MKDSVVYILGAGCSVKSGYPLASGFVSALESFSGTLGDGTAKLKRCVDETVTLLKKQGASTIDELTFRIHQGALDDPYLSSVKAYGYREPRILKAKIATAAMFLHLEQGAKNETLDGYRRLVQNMFSGSGNWQERASATRCHLLTFNYDRLFELTLLRTFGIDSDTQLLYGEDLLNSGLHHCMGSNMGFKKDRFCYLKLHGSIGMRIREEYGQPRYYPYHDGAKPGEHVELTDKHFFANSTNSHPQDWDPEPLIVFPFEKDFVRSGKPNGLFFRDYITAVWTQAESVIESANEIRFIGYSFAEMDRSAVFGLLDRAKLCRRLVIQNLPGEAERICQMLAIERPNPNCRLIANPCEF